MPFIHSSIPELCDAEAFVENEGDITAVRVIGCNKEEHELVIRFNTNCLWELVGWQEGFKPEHNPQVARADLHGWRSASGEERRADPPEVKHNVPGLSDNLSLEVFSANSLIALQVFDPRDRHRWLVVYCYPGELAGSGILEP